MKSRLPFQIVGGLAARLGSAPTRSSLDRRLLRFRKEKAAPPRRLWGWFTVGRCRVGLEGTGHFGHEAAKHLLCGSHDSSRPSRHCENTASQKRRHGRCILVGMIDLVHGTRTTVDGGEGLCDVAVMFDARNSVAHSGLWVLVVCHVGGVTLRKQKIFLLLELGEPPEDFIV